MIEKTKVPINKPPHSPHFLLSKPVSTEQTFRITKVQNITEILNNLCKK